LTVKTTIKKPKYLSNVLAGFNSSLGDFNDPVVKMKSSIAKRLQDPQQLAPLKSHNGFKNVWDLFFKDYSYLNKLAIPPILLGSALNDIISGKIEVWERPHLGLVCPGDPDPVLLKHFLSMAHWA
jgi:hypothetical protein